MKKNEEPSSQVPYIGTQINIQNMNVDMSRKSLEDEEHCHDDDFSSAGLLLGSHGKVDAETLLNVLQEIMRDGKHKNSPMLIKFH